MLVNSTVIFKESKFKSFLMSWLNLKFWSVFNNSVSYKTRRIRVYTYLYNDLYLTSFKILLIVKTFLKITYILFSSWLLKHFIGFMMMGILFVFYVDRILISYVFPITKTLFNQWSEHFLYKIVNIIKNMSKLIFDNFL